MDVTRDPELPQDASWITGRLTVGRPRVRLICLPQAGAGAGAFSRWRAHVQDGFELAPVEYPGRGAAGSRPVPDGFDALVEELLTALAPEMAMPFALFGHSFGGLLAYEMACLLQERGGPAPLAVLVSGSRAPQVPPLHKVSDEDDQALINWLVDNGGLPLELLRYTDFLQQTIGTIRTDLVFAENYLRPQPTRLRGPLHVFGGIVDKIAPCDGLNDWHACAGGDFSTTVMPGGHSFPHTDPAAILASVAAVLPDLASLPDPAPVRPSTPSGARPKGQRYDGARELT
ncbi:thioesterase II family protein [Streptantibioticus silvisoli]|uniref:Alpha/beta fold hydrolase n=1 Tax=Streptantibioticus silvisoli TaxID=2705255 RepID=A0ABT6W9J5_9ACTN|nr:alpha/beta fold hydrolase [Streptantibioticus silvisoli]MDI5967437.1 alpha/beta fold hydrolase [Streptantibioticus silvisoli]